MAEKEKKRTTRALFSSLPRPKVVHTSPFVTIRSFVAPKDVKRSVFMVTISSKEVSKAVTRNLLRRRYRHILHDLFPPTESPVILQCIVRKGASSAAFHSLQSDLAGLKV